MRTTLSQRLQELVQACFTGLWIQSFEQEDALQEIAGLCRDRMTLVSGDDSMTLPLISIGGKGVISVLSNLVPDRVKALTDAALAGDFDTAREYHLDLFGLCKVMFIETNPIPIKTAMAFVGMDTGELRLPLCEMAAPSRALLETVLREAGVGQGAKNVF